MSFLVVQAPQCPLSSSTRSAWKSAGGVVLKPRNLHQLRRWLAEPPAAYRNPEFIVNSGFSLFTQDDTHVPVINSGDTVSWTTTPYDTYEMVGEFMGEVNRDFSGVPYWLKGPGRGGSNSRYQVTFSPFYTTPPYITQRHYEGVEYRINTVGRRIVQVHQRSGPNHARQYNWVGLSGTQRSIKNTLRDALGSSVHKQTLLAWDTIYNQRDDKLIILEANSSPGLNTATAHRIVNEINTQLEEQRAS